MDLNTREEEIRRGVASKNASLKSTAATSPSFSRRVRLFAFESAQRKHLLDTVGWEQRRPRLKDRF